MRRFELQVFDQQMNLIDKFPLDLTTNPSGLGFTQKVELIETKTIDYIVNQQLKKSDIKLQAHFEEPHSYLKINTFRSWYGKNIKNKTVLYYNDGHQEKWIDCIIKDFGITEISAGINTVPLTIQCLSPFYQIKQKAIVSVINIIGKSYPYSYPYAYGGGSLTNTELDNIYFEPIPLKVRVMGKVVNPTISLRNKITKNIYTTVRFQDLILEVGQILEIDALNSRILLYNSPNDQNPLDYYNEIDKSEDTFLYANSGTSEIVANLDQNEVDAKIQVTYVQYIV